MKTNKVMDKNTVSSIDKIIRQCWENESFRKDVTMRPIPTIEKYLGETVNLDDGKKLVIEDQTDESTVYFNIPAQPNLDELELSEEQLSLVAGGATPTTIILITVCFTAGVVIGAT